MGTSSARILEVPLSPVYAYLKLLSVTRRGNGWELEIQSRWKELVLINGDYQVISHQRVP